MTPISSLTRFLDAISNWLPTRKRPDLDAAIAALNPEKIYVENVRSALGVSTADAVDLCEAAVRQGLFERHIEVISPDGKVAVAAKSEAEIPATVSYWREADDEIDQIVVPTSGLPKLLSYSLR